MLREKPLLMESARSTTAMHFGKGKAKYESQQVLSFLLSHCAFSSVQQIQV